MYFGVMRSQSSTITRSIAKPMRVNDNQIDRKTISSLPHTDSEMIVFDIGDAMV